MDYSSLFVCLMGMGTVFFGLICLIVLDHSDERCLRTRTFPCRSDSRCPSRSPGPAEDRQALAAAIAAAVAEDLGTDITGIRILSLKKL